jgi:membrane protease YdiL (CAAX protease family)
MGESAATAILATTDREPVPGASVPQDVLTELVELALAGAIVAAFAAPLAALAALVARRCGQPIAPPWRVPLRPPIRADMPTEGFDLLYCGAFVLVLLMLFPTLAEIGGRAVEAAGVLRQLYGADNPHTKELRQLWGIICATPVFFVGWLAYRDWAARAAWPPVGRLAGNVAFGAGVWFVLTPIVLAGNVLTAQLAVWLGSPPQRHPMDELGVGSGVAQHVVFGVSICLCTPVIEETLFRGLLVGWACGRRYRPWLVMLLAAGITLLTMLLTWQDAVGPVVFAVVLAVGLFVVQRVGRARRWPVHLIGSVYATAALFAAGHSAVWPTPIPLFALGLGLGYLAVRTNGIAACVVLHGLFNAVSFVYLLRGVA